MTFYIRNVCKGILESPDYVESVKRRIRADTLPPAVEILFHHYAYGKPRDVVEVVQARGNLTGMSAEELAAEAKATAQGILEYQQQVRDEALAKETPATDSVM